MKYSKAKKAVCVVLIIMIIASAFIPTKNYYISSKAASSAVKTETKVVPIGSTNRAIIAKSQNGTIYTYRSSNEKIVQVSKNGVVTGKKKGKASVIRYITKNKKTQIDKVLQYKVEKFAIKGKKTVYVNGSYKFKTNATNAKFKSKNKKIATITAKGKLIPKKSGTVTIEAVSGTLKTKKKIKVKKDAIKKITASYSGATLYQGNKINRNELVVKAQYKSGKIKTITNYSLDKECFDTIGEHSVTVNYKKHTAKLKVAVSEKKVSSLQATYAGGSIAVGQSVQPKDLQVVAVYNDGTTKILGENEIALTNSTAKEKGTLAVIVTHTASGVQTTVNVLINGLSIMGVDTQYSEKILYTEDGVDASKIKILVTYEDGSTELVDASDIRIGSVTTEDGKAKIVLYYTVDGVEYSTILSVEERSRKLCGLVVEAVSDYIYIGKELNPANYVVKAIYSDGTEKVVTEWTSDYLPSKEEGSQTIHFQYSEDGIVVNAEKEFEIKQANPVAIEVISAPGMVKEGMEIDTSQIEVKLQYEDGESEKLTNYQMDYNREDVTLGNRQVVVSYGDFSDTFEIQVIAKKVTELIVTDPTMQTITGQELNLTGMTVTAKYDNNTSGVVSGWTTNYSANLAPGVHQLVVSYDGVEATFTAQVTSPLEVQQSAVSDIVKHPVTISSNYGDVSYSLASGSANISATSGTSCTVTPMTPGNVVINIKRNATNEVKQITINATAYKMSYTNTNGGNAAIGDTLVFSTNAPTLFTYRMETDSGTVNTGTATPSNYTYSHLTRNTGKLIITAKDLVSGEELTKSVNVYKELAINGKSSVAVGSSITLKTTKQVVTWKSSDKTIATVSSEGVVKGKKAGSVTITATFPEYGNRTATKVITVTKK